VLREGAEMLVRVDAQALYNVVVIGLALAFGCFLIMVGMFRR